MKTQPFKPFLILAACAVTALPLAAAPRGDTSNRNSTTAPSSSDRRLDFGKPVRFVKNTFTRDDNAQNGRSMSQGQHQKDDNTHFWNRDDNKDRSSNRSDHAAKKDDKPNMLSRMLSWRPFNRDKDR